MSQNSIDPEVEELLGEPDLEDMERMANMAFAGPAPFANRFLITSHGSVVRISFGDQNRVGTHPHFRSGVSMIREDAQQLVEILKRFLEDGERLLAARNAKGS